MARRWHVEHADGREWTISELEEWMRDVCDVDFGIPLVSAYGVPYLEDDNFSIYPFTSSDAVVVWDEEASFHGL